MFSGYKTYIAGAVAVIGALAAYLTGDATAIQAGQLAVTAVMGMFLRAGVSKAENA